MAELHCEVCKKAFTRDAWALKNRGSRFCSRPCWRAGFGTPLERFWRHVQKQPNGCWLWTGTKTKGGYGQLTVDGKREYAHRFSYELHKGELGADKEACHQCPENRKDCVCPDHLYKGDHADNMRDLAAEGRGIFGMSKDQYPRGDRHWRRRAKVAS